jgi:carbamoylphosphate synthase small subunit
MKKIEVQGLGVAYLPSVADMKNHKKLSKYYAQADIWRIKDMDTRKTFYSTDKTPEEEGVNVTVLVSKKLIKKVGMDVFKSEYAEEI